MASIWDIIGAAGNVLDLPGSSVRDALALENPLDQWLTPTTGENRIGGRQLLDKWGITPENEETGMAGWLENPMEGVRDVAGFAVEATLDPLNLVSGSAIARAFRGGAAARKANAARTVLLESPERARVLDEMGQAFGPGAAPTMDVLDSFALGQQGMPPESVYSRLSAGPAAPLAEDVLFQGEYKQLNQSTPTFTSKVYDAIESPKFPKTGSKETMISALKKAGISKRELDDMLPEIDRAVEFADKGRLVKDQLGSIAQDNLEKRVGELTVEMRGQREVDKFAVTQGYPEGQIPKLVYDDYGATWGDARVPGGMDDDYYEMLVRHPAVAPVEDVASHMSRAGVHDVLFWVRGDVSSAPAHGFNKTARLLEIQSDYHQAGQKGGYLSDVPKADILPERGFWHRATKDGESARFEMPGTGLSAENVKYLDNWEVRYKGRPIFGSFGGVGDHGWSPGRPGENLRNLYRHRAELEKKYDEFLEWEGVVWGDESVDVADPVIGEDAARNINEAMDEYIDDNWDRFMAKPIPDAPFKTEWPEMGVQLFLEKAVRDGADSVFLPDGDVIGRFNGARQKTNEKLLKFYRDFVSPQIEKRLKKHGVKGERYEPGSEYTSGLVSDQGMEMERLPFFSEYPGTLWKIPPEFIDEVLNKGQTLYQPNRGQAAFSGDSARLSPLENPDFSTPLHESGHVMRRMLGEANPDLAQRAGELFGGGQQWDRAAEERFAQGLERYAQTARPESPALRQTMDQFRPELDQLYQDNPLADLNQAQTALYDEILGIRGQLSPLDRRRSPSMAKPMLAAVLQNMAARQERM